MLYRLTTNPTSKFILLLSLTAILWACSNDKKPNIPTVELSAELSSKYQASCQACHEVANTGAPQRGDQDAWTEVFQSPFTDIMEKVVNGSQGMPPLGQCFDCDAHDLETLVYYLAQPASAEKP